ncbi:hypothetical protein ACFXPZ_38635 [Streptomyces sp. NPDC059101]|uniref:hypothetical protein n=1 Tax=Streptomyces sp. NPDC059101 TaxID=3346728 RepID=UPI0036BFB46D
MDLVAGDLAQRGDGRPPPFQDRDQVAEVPGHRFPRHGARFSPTFTAQHRDPHVYLAEQVGRHPLTQSRNAGPVRVGMPDVIGDEQAPFGKEGDKAPGVVARAEPGDRPQIGFLDGYVQTEPGRDRDQGPLMRVEHLLLPPVVLGVLGELLLELRLFVAEHGQLAPVQYLPATGRGEEQRQLAGGYQRG